MSTKVDPVIAKIRKVTEIVKSPEKRKSNHFEMAPWYEAVENFNHEYPKNINQLVSIAWKNLTERPNRIPRFVRKKNHLHLHSRRNNPIVLELLETYGAAYKANAFGLYPEGQYMGPVLNYHKSMVSATNGGNYDIGYELLIEQKITLSSSRFSVWKDG